MSNRSDDWQGNSQALYFLDAVHGIRAKISCRVTWGVGPDPWVEYPCTERNQGVDKLIPVDSAKHNANSYAIVTIISITHETPLTKPYLPRKSPFS